MTSETILTFTLAITCIVGVLNLVLNSRKTKVDITDTREETIGRMSTRLDIQGARLDTQSVTIEGLRADLKTRDGQLAESQLETKEALRKLAESQQQTADALLKLDHLPEKVEAQRIEIERLVASAKVVEDTNLASARARETTAKNVADAKTQQPTPTTDATTDASQIVTVTTPAEIHVIEKPDDPNPTK